MPWLSWRTSPRRCIEDVRLFVNPRHWLTWPCSVVFIVVYNKCVILLSKWVTLNAAPCTNIAKDAFSDGNNGLMEAYLKILAPSNVAQRKLTALGSTDIYEQTFTALIFRKVGLSFVPGLRKDTCKLQHLLNLQVWKQIFSQPQKSHYSVWWKYVMT